MQIEDKVAVLVAEKIADRPELFLVEVKMLPNKTLLIYVDGDEGITIEDCVAISRYVGFHLEEENAIQTAYNLEVSSPGVGEPLKLSRQYVKNIGRTLSLKLLDGTHKEGKLLSADEHEMIIEEEIKEKGKKKSSVTTILSFKDVVEAIVLVSFK